MFTSMDHPSPSMTPQEGSEKSEAGTTALILSIMAERSPSDRGRKSLGMSLTVLASCGKSCTNMSQLMIEVILAHSRNRWLERRNSLTSSFRRIGEKVRREKAWANSRPALVPFPPPPTALSDQREVAEHAAASAATAALCKSRLPQ